MAAHQPLLNDRLDNLQAIQFAHADRDESTSFHVRLPGCAHAAACATAAGAEPGTGHFLYGCLPFGRRYFAFGEKGRCERISGLDCRTYPSALMDFAARALIEITDSKFDKCLRLAFAQSNLPCHWSISPMQAGVGLYQTEMLFRQVC